MCAYTVGSVISEVLVHGAGSRWRYGKRTRHKKRLVFPMWYCGEKGVNVKDGSIATEIRGRFFIIEYSSDRVASRDREHSRFSELAQPSMSVGLYIEGCSPRR